MQYNVPSKSSELQSVQHPIASAMLALAISNDVIRSCTKITSGTEVASFSPLEIIYIVHVLYGRPYQSKVV